jgi:hypothetical protein
MEGVIDLQPGQKDHRKRRRRRYTAEEKRQVQEMRKLRACPSCKAKQKKVTLSATRS